MESEVIIIGGGVIGLAIARSLHQKGVRKIKILERGTIGKESSFAAAGMLAPQSETDQVDDFFRLCIESNEMYPRFANDLYDETGIDVELDQSGTLYLAFKRADIAQIEKRFEFQKKAGLKIERMTAREIRRSEPFVSPDVLEGLFFENDWQVENRKLLAALERFAKLNQIEIVENEEVEKINFTEPICVESKSRKHYARHVVAATGAWTSFIKTSAEKMPDVKPIRGQMISFHTAKRLFSKVIYSPRGYIVPRKLGRIVAGATVEDAGFDKSTTSGGMEQLLQNAHEIVPSLAGLAVDETWAGLRPFAANGFPVLGSFPQCGNLHVATAHYRNGILLAPLTAELIANKVVSNSHSKYLEIFGLKAAENSVKSAAGTEV